MSAPDTVRERLHTWDDPMATASGAIGVDGITFLRRLAAGEIPAPPIARTLGMEVESVQEGRVVFSLMPSEFHYNPIGSVHGGVALTLLDSAMGCAVHTLLDPGVGYTTLEVKANFVRAITAETGLVRCEGTVVHAGTRVATAEGRVTDAAGKLLAHGTTTCLVIR